MTLRRHNSSAKSARELFKCSKYSANLVVCNKKFFFSFKFRIFCEWHHKKSTFRPPSSSPRPKLIDCGISLKFLMETRVKSESFETLDDVLGGSKVMI